MKISEIDSNLSLCYKKCNINATVMITMMTVITRMIIIITEYDKCRWFSVRSGRFEADEEPGISRLNVTYCQVTLSLHTARNVHSEPAANSAINPLPVEYGRRLVHPVTVVIPSCLVVGARSALEHDCRPRQHCDIVWPLHFSLRSWQ